MEAALDSAYLSRDSYGEGQEIRLHVPQVTPAQSRVRVELVSGKKILQATHWETDPAEPFIALGVSRALQEGDYRVRLSAGPNTRDIEMEVAR